MTAGAVNAPGGTPDLENVSQESPRNRLTGWPGALAATLAVAMSLLFMYWAWASVTTQIARIVFLLFTLVLSFLLYPMLASQRDGKVHWTSWILVGLSIVALGYPIVDFEEFIYRSATPDALDQILGAVTILLVLEATRRSTGWILPVVAIAALAYAWFGPYLPPPWTHRGYGLPRLIGHMYMTLEGIFGSALDVAATFILLFGVYGAVLNYSKASDFFMNLSLALTRGKPTSGGRAVTLASFLLGGPSGSGVATTVTLGSVVWPLLAKAGYTPAAAGGLLAAGGIGATLSPPVLGAAAFLIAEFLKISYFDVIVMAIIPTILYYWSVLWMVEFDAKRMGTKAISTGGESVRAIVRKDGFHFISLFAVVGFMMLGMSATLAVIYAILLAIGVSFVRPTSALGPRRLWKSMETGATSTLSVAATCAAAGIIVGVVTLTGLGLKFSSIVVSMAGESLFLTAVYTAFAMWLLGLAVPVTASYIIAAVILAPALIQLGVPDYAAHMFIFYYAVLADVSPPTALAPFAAATITGANPFKTTMMAWKYTLPAFLVPLMFVLDPSGLGLLAKGPWTNIIWSTVTAMLGLSMLASGLTGWLLQRTTKFQSGLLVLGGLALVYPHWIADMVGMTCGIAAFALQWLSAPAAARLGVHDLNGGPETRAMQ